MTGGRFALAWTDRVGVESVAVRDDNAELLLRLRDKRRGEGDRSVTGWRVLDGEQLVEWCASCADRVVVGDRELCPSCQHDVEIAAAFAVRWDWPAPPEPVASRRVFDIGEFSHWL